MSNLLNALKEKFIHLKQNAMLRTVLISVLALLLIFSVTLAWYINNLGMWGMEFNTGNIDFKAYVYSEDGVKLFGPISPDDEDLSQYLNVPLATIENAQVGSLGTVYIAIESCGSIGIDYRIAFDVSGKTDKATAYLGGYKYNISNVTDKVTFNGGNNMNVSNCERPERIVDEIVTIDRNAVNGTIEEKNDYDVYRFDYTLVNKNEEYTGSSIKIFFNVFATQVGGDFEDTEERGYIYYCSSKEDLDRAKVEAYPGDIIKLTSDIVYYGDLVFNKPINLETNDFTLTVNGNLMYDYVLGNSLKVDAGGLGRIIVQCTKEGVGGNLKIKAPLSDVTLIGSNTTTGDIIVEKTVSIDATNAFGSPGVTFNNTRIVDEKNSRKTILLDSNTRATVSFGTTIGLIQSVVKANNIEIVNNGIIGDINLSNMELLDQTNSPQIYILNNHTINNPIALPTWSEKFVEDSAGNCTGNTKIIQSYSGGSMTVTGNCRFDNDDIIVEMKEALVEQIEEGDDSRLKIYYQNVGDWNTTIEEILVNYFDSVSTTGGSLSEIVQLEIISIGTKGVTMKDIQFMNGSKMLSLRYLDMQRATIYDESKNTYHRLPDNAFRYVDKYETLILPQNLTAIGSYAMAENKIQNFITVPSGVTSFGTYWFIRSQYVSFAASVPPTSAVDGLIGVHAIFVEEAYIGSYREVFSNYRDRVYPISVLDETKEHFVRNTLKDEWEITYYIRGEDAVIGEDITIDGEVLKITSIYDFAYSHNYSANEIFFEDTVENVGSGNFANKKDITYVDLNNVKTLGTNVFYGCTNLSTVEFGDKLEVIGDYAFYRCQSLKQDVVLPVTMKEIRVSAFQETPITYVSTGGATTIHHMAFYACRSLISADLPNVTEIAPSGKNEVFSYCTSLVSASMPSVTKVNGDKIFQGCTSLHELFMGTKHEEVSLGNGPFIGCDATKIKLFVPEEHLEFFRTKRPGNINIGMIYPMGEKMGEQLVNGFNIGEYIVLNNGDNTYSLVTSNISHTGKYSVPGKYNGNLITKIYDYCFKNQSFTDVTLTLGNNVKEIGDNAFYGLNGLSEIVIGNALEKIGVGSFAYCANISQDIVLPDTMVSIGDDAFSNSGILSVNTGGTTAIGSRVFQYCGSLVHAVMPEVTAIAEGGRNEVFSNCMALVSVDLPKVTLVQGGRMFAYCTSMHELYLGTKDANLSFDATSFTNMNVAQVKLYVPSDAVSLYVNKKIVDSCRVYPRGEKVGNKSVGNFVIGDYIVLKNDTGYTLVTSNLEFTGDVNVLSEYKGLPITEIYANAFRNQKFTDTNLMLTDKVITIGERAFYNLSGLKSVKMDGVTTVGVEAFAISGLKVLNGLQLTSIGKGAFRNCLDLELVNLPVLETNLEGDAFLGCRNLKSVYFENVMSLNQSTFNQCYKLEKVTINRLIDSDGGNMPQTMKIESTAPCKIYVPYRSLSAYPSTWSGKPVVSFDLAVTHGGNTYVLSEQNTGRYMLIDFLPSKSSDTVTLPASVTVNGANIPIYGIKNGAFSTVAGTLKNMTLPSSVAVLEKGALSECSVLQSIYVTADNRYFTSVNGVLYSKDGKMLVKYPVGRSGKFDMTAAGYASTVGIGATAFTNATGLTEIVFPASLAVIDGSAFENCTKLHTVQFTGTTPPVLMGCGIFDTSVADFKMVIPTTDASVVTAYLCAYNFSEYEPFINIGSHTAPDATTDRNKVMIG